MLWDNGDQNMYRYGADNSYDVILWVRVDVVSISANPMFRDDFVPQGGFEEWSESTSQWGVYHLVSWEKYVHHYAHNGVYKSRGFFGGHITCEELTHMLPTYDRAVLYDGGVRDGT